MDHDILTTLQFLSDPNSRDAAAEILRCRNRISELEAGIRAVAAYDCAHCRYRVPLRDDGIDMYTLWHRVDSIDDEMIACGSSRLLRATKVKMAAPAHD